MVKKGIKLLEGSSQGISSNSLSNMLFFILNEPSCQSMVEQVSDQV